MWRKNFGCVISYSNENEGDGRVFYAKICKTKIKRLPVGSNHSTRTHVPATVPHIMGLVAILFLQKYNILRRLSRVTTKYTPALRFAFAIFWPETVTTNAGASPFTRIWPFTIVTAEHDLKNILSKISLFVKKSFQFF